MNTRRADDRTVSPRPMPTSSRASENAEDIRHPAKLLRCSGGAGYSKFVRAWKNRWNKTHLMEGPQTLVMEPPRSISYSLESKKQEARCSSQDTHFHCQSASKLRQTLWCNNTRPWSRLTPLVEPGRKPNMCQVRNTLLVCILSSVSVPQREECAACGSVLSRLRTKDRCRVSLSVILI